MRQLPDVRPAGSKALTIAAALTSRSRVATAFVCACIALLGFSGTVAAAAATTFTRGFVDNVWIYPANEPESTGQWAHNVYTAGGRIAEIEVDWAGYEVRAPAVGTNPANPRNPAYGDWPALDTTVKTLERAGIQPMLLITDAPTWAERAGPAASQTEGYAPNDSALKNFIQALATRYDGRYPEPGNRDHPLPRVRYYQDWAEANLPSKLLPEWVKSHGHWVDEGAIIYRNMLNAFYTGVKRAMPSDVVIFSGLEAYGDAPGKGLKRVHPATFLENVLCLNAKLQKVCNKPAHFDVMAADPYDSYGPTVHAFSAADISAPDLGRLTPILDAAIADRTVYPDSSKPLWVTEFSYESDPPNPDGGLPLAKQARWLEQSFYTFWKEGVSTVLWYLIRDQPGTDYSTTYYSGIYFYDGQQKPSYTAYTFPLVVSRDQAHAQVWGIAPATGPTLIQQKRGSTWHTIHTFHTAPGQVFDTLIPTPTHGTQFRAIQGTSTSLTWTY